VGKRCANDHGLIGTCKLPWQCSSLKTQLANKQHPNMCGFDNVIGVPIICCAFDDEPDDQATSTTDESHGFDFDDPTGDFLKKYILWQAELHRKENEALATTTVRTTTTTRRTMMDAREELIARRRTSWDPREELIRARQSHPDRKEAYSHLRMVTPDSSEGGSKARQMHPEYSEEIAPTRRNSLSRDPKQEISQARQLQKGPKEEIPQIHSELEEVSSTRQVLRNDIPSTINRTKIIPRFREYSNPQDGLMSKAERIVAHLRSVFDEEDDDDDDDEDDSEFEKGQNQTDDHPDTQPSPVADTDDHLRRVSKRVEEAEHLTSGSKRAKRSPQSPMRMLYELEEDEFSPRLLESEIFNQPQEGVRRQKRVQVASEEVLFRPERFRPDVFDRDDDVDENQEPEVEKFPGSFPEVEEPQREVVQIGGASLKPDKMKTRGVSHKTTPVNDDEISSHFMRPTPKIHREKPMVKDDRGNNEEERITSEVPRHRGASLEGEPPDSAGGQTRNEISTQREEVTKSNLEVTKPNERKFDVTECLHHLRRKYLQRLRGDALPFVSKSGGRNPLPVDVEELYRVRRDGITEMFSGRSIERVCLEFGNKIEQELEFELASKLIEVFKKREEAIFTPPLPPHPDEDIILDEDQARRHAWLAARESGDRNGSIYVIDQPQTEAKVEVAPSNPSTARSLRFRLSRRRRWSGDEEERSGWSDEETRRPGTGQRFDERDRRQRERQNYHRESGDYREDSRYEGTRDEESRDRAPSHDGRNLDESDDGGQTARYSNTGDRGARLQLWYAKGDDEYSNRRPDESENVPPRDTVDGFIEDTFDGNDSGEKPQFQFGGGEWDRPQSGRPDKSIWTSRPGEFHPDKPYSSSPDRNPNGHSEDYFIPKPSRRPSRPEYGSEYDSEPGLRPESYNSEPGLRPDRYDSELRRTTRRPDRYDPVDSDRYDSEPRRTTRRPDYYDSEPKRTTRRPDYYDSEPKRTTRRPDYYDSEPRRTTRRYDSETRRTTTERSDWYDSEDRRRTSTRRPDPHDSEFVNHLVTTRTTRRPDPNHFNNYDTDSTDFFVPPRTTTRRPDPYDEDRPNYSQGNNYPQGSNYPQGNNEPQGNNYPQSNGYPQGNKPKASPRPGGIVYPSSGGNWGGNSYTTSRPDTDGGIVYPGEASTTNSPPRYPPKPTRSPVKAPRISETKCAEYKKLTKSSVAAVLPLAIDSEPESLLLENCPQNSVSLIVGGKEAVLNEFPHMVALGYKNRGRLTYNCGGTLISENFVLTAAHCIGTSLGKPVQVRLGELILNNEDDGASPVDVRVEQTTVHPDYRDDQKYNDIALVRLEREVSFSNSIRPACLHQQRDLSRSELPVATGWGTTDYGGKRSDALLKVGLSVINNTLCNRLYDKERRTAGSLERGISESMLCAGKLEGGKDTCLGDSGGPLGIPHPDSKCQHYIVGITSFGKVCGQENSPGVYTRVSSYLPWIENIVWNGQQ
ncbi:unnamed protein product, partial [Bemisia tabaci]